MKGRSQIRFAYSLIITLALVTVLRQILTEEPGLPVLPAMVGSADSFNIRILFGLKDLGPTEWNGRIKVSPGKVAKIEGWRFEQSDRATGTSGWEASTRRMGPYGEFARFTSAKQRPMLDNGVIVALEHFTDLTRVRMETAQGHFSFSLTELSYGKRIAFLDGAVEIERVPTSVQLTSSFDEQDFPAAAVAANDTVWVGYVQFVHNNEYQLRRPIATEPADFSYLAAPAGGDQVFLMKYEAGRWSPPIAISQPGRDIHGCAVAVDGKNRPWVIWSENLDGNVDLYGRFYAEGRFGEVIRLTTDSGSDIHPVAATDSHGRIWIAWQGFRGTNSDIFALRQDGDAFTNETVIASSPANEWDPAIATGKNGAVAIAWDTYKKGDYDVYFRFTESNGEQVVFGSEVPVAASLRYEVRPSVAYDQQNRLWVAWEESEERWGKDFGAYETTGVGLYHLRTIGIRAFVGQRPYVTLEKLTDVLPDHTDRRPSTGPRNLLPDPELATRRPAGNSAQYLSESLPVAKNSFPRLAVDTAGRVALAYRTIWPNWRGELGMVWFENVLVYDGVRWLGPIFIPNSDNLSENRPAFVGLQDGSLMVVHSSDHRRLLPRPQGAGAGAMLAPDMIGDRFNNDLYASRLFLPQSAKEAILVEAATEKSVQPEAMTAAEREAIQRMRKYRITVGGKKLQVMRGEFHRHTEISADGGGDGPLIDMWRYGLDAAAMDWIGNGDHDYGHGREYTWWLIQKTADVFHVGTAFVPMFTYERSCNYPQGHRNPVFAQRGIRPLLSRLPQVSEETPGSAPDTEMLYRYLGQFDGIVALHTSATDMGSDWRDNDPKVEPVVEIYQGDRQNYEIPEAPRSNNEKDSMGGWRPKGFVSRALSKGYRLGFLASSDHISTHMSYANVWVEAPTRKAILAAMKARHMYGSTDNILAEVRCGDHIMGDEFETNVLPLLDVTLIGTSSFSRVHVIRDGVYVYTLEPNSQTVQFKWRDTSPNRQRVSYYYVRGEQIDGELVWVSPMWIKYGGK